MIDHVEDFKREIRGRLADDPALVDVALDVIENLIEIDQDLTKIADKPSHKESKDFSSSVEENDSFSEKKRKRKPIRSEPKPEMDGEELMIGFTMDEETWDDDEYPKVKAGLPGSGVKPVEKPKPKKRKRRKRTGSAQADPLYTPTIEEWGDSLGDEPVIPAYVDQILPQEPGEGALIAGRTGIGKTNLGLYMAFCLASGTQFYAFDCEKTEVAFFAFEGGKSNFYDRIAKIRKNFPPGTGRRIRFSMISGQSANEMYKEVMRRLALLPEVKVVILDGARHIMEGNPSKGDVAQLFIQRLKMDLAELGKVAVLTLQVVKPNKSSKLHPGDIYTIKGAVEIAAWATTSLLIETKMRKTNEYQLFFDKHRIATDGHLETIDLVYSFDKCMFKKPMTDTEALKLAGQLAGLNLENN
jgi:hypothetical protein